MASLFGGQPRSRTSSFQPGGNNVGNTHSGTQSGGTGISQSFHPSQQQQQLYTNKRLLAESNAASAATASAVAAAAAATGSSRTGSAGSGSVSNNNSGRPQFYSDFFRKYELMIEFTNLKNPHHCPSGVYVMPAPDNTNLWFGTLFVHRGYYKNAVFKFQLSIPQEYPDVGPTVHFLSDMFHPLIDQHGQLSLQYQFPTWTAHHDYLFHVLHYIKAVFKKCVLDTITEKQATNKEAQRMYKNEPTIFAKLAQQRAQLSITESNLYDTYPANSSIKFGPLSDAEFDELKQKMMRAGATAK